MTKEYGGIGNYGRPGLESTGCEIAFALIALAAALALLVV